MEVVDVTSDEMERLFGVTAGQLEAEAAEYESEDWSRMRFGPVTGGTPRPPEGERLRQVTVSVPESRLAELRRSAERQGLSTSEWIRRAIDMRLSAIA